MNKNTKHTPGPWYAVQPAGANGWWVVSKDKEGVECVDESHDGGFKESTARLIAAAPDLLTALEGLLEITDFHELYGSKTEAARAAIAKATGEHHD